MTAFSVYYQPENPAAYFTAGVIVLGSSSEGANVRTVICERNRRFLRRRLRHCSELFKVGLGLLIASMLIVLPARTAAVVVGQGRISSEEVLGLLVVAVNSTVVRMAVQTARQWAASCRHRWIKVLIVTLNGLISFSMLFAGEHLVVLVSQMPATRYWLEMVNALTGPILHCMMNPKLARLRFVVPELHLLTLWIIRCHRRAQRTERSSRESSSAGISSVEQEAPRQSVSVSCESEKAGSGQETVTATSSPTAASSNAESSLS